MAVQALWLQNLDYPARWDRTVFDQLWSEGTLTTTSFAVAQSATPAMTVQVAAGTAVVQGDDQAFQGKYLCREENATTGVAIAAAPGSGTRYDLVVLKVNDPNAGGAAGDNAVITVVTGTASGSPVDPAVPNSALVLARVTVASGTGTITNAMITDLRVPARVENATAPAGSVMPYAGTTAPAGWLLCDGTAYSQTIYASLYTVIGGTYNTSAGQSAPAVGTFRVPILTGRIPVGLDSAQTEFDTLGETGGSKSSTASHTHTMAHDHAIDHDHGSFTTAVAGTHNHAATFSLTADNGGTHTHAVTNTLGIVNNGNHTHNISTNAGEGAHQHQLNANQTPSGTHGHTTNGTLASGLNGSGGSTSAYTNSFVAGYEGKHTHSGATDTQGDHGHSISGGIAVNSGDGSHSHSVSGSVSVTAGQGSHDHTIDVPNYTGTSGASSAANTGAGSVDATSGNLQPYLVLNYIIKF